MPTFADLMELRIGADKVVGHPDRMVVVLRKCLRWLPSLERPVEEYTLKTYRAGRATELAATGYGLDEIRCYGEWRSKTGPVPYINTEIGDASQQLCMMIRSSMEPDEVDLGAAGA